MYEKYFLIAFFVMPVLAVLGLRWMRRRRLRGVSANAALVREVRVGKTATPLRVSRVKACCGRGVAPGTEIPAGRPPSCASSSTLARTPGCSQGGHGLYSDDPKCPVLILRLTAR